MPQAQHECSRCHRVRYASRLQEVKSHGVTFWVCSARTSCKVAARLNSG